MTVTAVDAAGNPVPGFLGTVYFSSNDPTMKAPSFYLHLHRRRRRDAHLRRRDEPDHRRHRDGHGLRPLVDARHRDDRRSPPRLPTWPCRRRPPPTAGTSYTETVTAEDALGNVATGYTGTVHFTSTDVQAGLPADYTFTAADAGSTPSRSPSRRRASIWTSVTDTASPALSGGSYVSVTPAAASTLSVVGGAGSIGVSRS